MKIVNYLLAIFLIVFSSAIYFAAGAFAKTTMNDLGPSLFPRSVAIGLFLLGLTLIWFTYRNNTVGMSVSEVFDKNTVFPLYGIAFFSLYIVGLEWLGYLFSTTIFMVAMLWFLRMRKPVNLVLIALGTSIAIYFVFEKLLMVPLPRGDIF